MYAFCFSVAQISISGDNGDMNREQHNRKHRRDQVVFGIVLALVAVIMLAGCGAETPAGEPGMYKACRDAGGEWVKTQQGNRCVGYQKTV